MSTISHLSQPRKQFLDLMRRVGFGRIHNIKLYGGEPVLNPLPRVTLTHKFGKDSGHSETIPTGPALKQSHVNLFLLFDTIGDGTIDELIVAHGVPLQAERTA